MEIKAHSNLFNQNGQTGSKQSPDGDSCSVIYGPSDQGLDKIKEFGYLLAKDKYEIWKELAEDESEEIPRDENGLFDQIVFCDELNNTLWEFGFDEMEKNPSLARVFESCGIDKAGYAFFDGVNQFIKECFNKT